MSELTQAIGMVAPLYNLVFVAIAVWFFAKLFTMKIINKRVYLAPWKWIFIAVLIFIVEEVVTVLRATQVIQVPRFINGFFELAIISVFIYALLLQREHVQKMYL